MQLPPCLLFRVVCLTLDHTLLCPLCSCIPTGTILPLLFASSLSLFFLVTPHTRCRLRLLKQERIKDFLLLEEEFIQNQQRLKPTEEKDKVCHSEERGSGDITKLSCFVNEWAQRQRKGFLTDCFAAAMHAFPSSFFLVGVVAGRGGCFNARASHMAVFSTALFANIICPPTSPFSPFE